MPRFDHIDYRLAGGAKPAAPPNPLADFADTRLSGGDFRGKFVKPVGAQVPGACAQGGMQRRPPLAAVDRLATKHRLAVDGQRRILRQADQFAKRFTAQ